MKTSDSGYRDTELIKKTMLIDGEIIINQKLDELKKKLMEEMNLHVEKQLAEEIKSISGVVDRHNHHFAMEEGIRTKFLNTFDIDELIGNSNVRFDCLLQEQGRRNFQPEAINEYKNADFENGIVGTLDKWQKMALFNLVERADLDSYCFWSYPNGDGTYTWFALGIRGENKNKMGKLSDRGYYKLCCEMRGIEPTRINEFSNKITPNYKEIAERLKNYGYVKE